MSRRVEQEPLDDVREPIPRSTDPQPPPHPLIPLQRAIGNQAFGRLVQRQVRVKASTINSDNYDRFKPGLSAALAELAKTREWKSTFVEEVRARMVELIDDETVYPDRSGAKKVFGSYKEFVKAVATEVASRNAPMPKAFGTPLPTLDPVEVEMGEAQIDWEESLLGQIHDEASQYREEEMEDIPEEFLVGANRRSHQKGGTLDPTVPPKVGIGSYVGEVRGHGSVVTNVGGGQGADYKDLWSLFTTSLAFAKKSEQDAANDIRAMLHGTPSALLKYNAFSLGLMDQILTILAGAESTRATGSVIHFAATIHQVAEGNGNLVTSFSGNTATFLGANDGGADALRHTTPSTLVKQESRARDAAEVYLSTYGKNMDVRALVAALQKNIASYSRLRQEKKS